MVGAICEGEAGTGLQSDSFLFQGIVLSEGLGVLWRRPAHHREVGLCPLPPANDRIETP